MVSSSTKVVYAALIGNVLVAFSKFVAAAVSGSGAMLTEGIHSTVDSANQVLPLIGNKRSSEPADATHNFGHGGEVYFWTFVVAVLVMLAGGAASFFEGILKLRHPEPIERFGPSLGVLSAAVLFEGASFHDRRARGAPHDPPPLHPRAIHHSLALHPISKGPTSTRRCWRMAPP